VTQNASSAKSPLPAQAGQLPAYLEDNYWWAYLRPASLKVFDHTLVVSAILWGCYRRLKQAAFVELKPGQKVLQAACVYGDFSSRLAKLLGAEGGLDIVDIAPIQAANCRRKLREFSHAQVRVADAAEPGGGPYDVVFCFFLLHELPDYHKRRVVDALLNSVTPGGKVVFIDYHEPDRRHPLKALMGIVFDYLEPFAKALWRSGISSFATPTENFTWRKETYFGGLYQKVVAERCPVGRGKKSWKKS
jgi:ubiquinone/menaquinone biosynthesis C-methylase UbiE